MDMVTFDNIIGQLGFDPLTVGPAGFGLSQYDYDFTGVHENSDLNIQQWDIALEGIYQLTSRLALSAGINYINYNEDEIYLADESGSAYIAMLNLRYWFK